MMMRCGAVSSSPLIDNSLDDVLEENIKSCRYDVGACRQYPVNGSLYYYYDRAYPRIKQETCNFRRVTLDRVTIWELFSLFRLELNVSGNKTLSYSRELFTLKIKRRALIAS